MEPWTPADPGPTGPVVPAGWYEDPYEPVQNRYWDGQVWTDHVMPREPVAPPAAPQPPAQPAHQAQQAQQPVQQRPQQPVHQPVRPPFPQQPRPQRPGTHPAFAAGVPARPRRGRGVKALLFVLGAAGAIVVLVVVSAVLSIVKERDRNVAQPPSSCRPPGASAVAVPAVLAKPAAKGGPVMTPKAAAALVQTVWPLREQALHGCDQATLTMLDTGTARIGDLDRSACGCLIRPAGASIEELRLFVPRASAYPAWFGAQVRTVSGDGTGAGTSWLEQLVFVRPSATSHWQLTLATGWTGAPGEPAVLNEPDTDAAGYLRGPKARERQDARASAAALATLYQRSKDTGQPAEHSFRPGYWTSDLAAEIAAHRQDTVQGNGLLGHFRYRFGGREPVYHLTVRGGADLACTVIRTRTVYTPRPGGGVPRQDAAQKNWGASLAPGNYRSITSDGVSQTCFYRPPDAGAVSVLGGAYAEEGVVTGVPVD